MRFIFLAIGTALAVLFILQLLRGKKYDSMLEAIDDKDFPAKELFGVGFAWGEFSPFALKGKIESDLKSQATILYSLQYSDYYANVVWAQTLTYVHLGLTLTFLLAGFLYEALPVMLIGGGFLTLLLGVYAEQGMKNKISARTEACDMELPEVVSTMAVLVNSGMVLREAWALIAENGQGLFYDLMKKASINMQNGYSDADAIFLFGKEANSPEVKKFTSALLQSMEKGGAELSVFLAKQSSEMWQHKRQHMLQKGEKAATKLLLPIVIIFIGILIIIITAAFAGSMF